MPAFTSRPLNMPKFNRSIKKNPALFGVPFVLLMIAASYGLTTFTQTRYELHDQKVKQVWSNFIVFAFSHAMRVVSQVTKEQELGLKKNRKKFDIREEYFVSLGSVETSSHRSNCQHTATQCCSRRKLGTKTNTASTGVTRMGCATHRTTL
jgi:cytochrome c oxidase assembly protein subunit 16